MEAKFNHFDHNGNAVMVDVSDKAVTERTAVASGKIRVNDAVMRRSYREQQRRGMCWGWREWQGSWPPNRPPV